MSAKSFIAQFLKKGNKVGAVAPSSRFLAAKMLKQIPFDRCETIVEFGPGTGAFTGYIQEKMQPNARLIIIELNEIFCRDLIQKYGNHSRLSHRFIQHPIRTRHSKRRLHYFFPSTGDFR